MALNRVCWVHMLDPLDISGSKTSGVHPLTLFSFQTLLFCLEKKYLFIWTKSLVWSKKNSQHICDLFILHFFNSLYQGVWSAEASPFNVTTQTLRLFLSWVWPLREPCHRYLHWTDKEKKVRLEGKNVWRGMRTPFWPKLVYLSLPSILY